MSMKNLSTLCYLEKDGKYLMLHRTVKKMMSIKINGSVSEGILKKGKARKNACFGRSERRQAIF